MLKIYLIGVFVTWIILKLLRIVDKDKSWEGIWLCIIVSLFSWIGLGVAFFATIVHFVHEETWDKISTFINKIFKKPPPRWL